MKQLVALLGLATAACGGMTTVSMTTPPVPDSAPPDAGAPPALCLPKSCQALKASCGEASDGCGEMLECGECIDPASCGGGGTVSVCGLKCGLGCPQGYACDLTWGVCQGSGPLTLDLSKVVRIAGHITLNGRPSADSCTVGNKVQLKLLDPAQQRTETASVTCTSEGLPYELTVVPGTYQLWVRSELGTDFPGVWMLAEQAAPLLTEKEDFTIDVKVLELAGAVTINGQGPAQTCTAASPATVKLTDVAHANSFTAAVPCSSTTPFTFSSKVYPGTWKLEVRGNPSSNLPTAYTTAQAALVVTQPKVDLTLDVQTATVDGVVTLNGASPTGACTTGNRGTVKFFDATANQSFSFPIPCAAAGTPFSFRGGLFPGTYQVSVVGSANSQLPPMPVLVDPALAITGNRANMTLDVKAFHVAGAVTVNGATPTATCASATSQRATVKFTETTSGATASVAIRCPSPSAPLTVDTLLPAGSYRVQVKGAANSGVPTQDFAVSAPLLVSRDAAGFGWDVKTVKVSGVVTHNGQSVGANCTGTAARGYVDFEQADSGPGFSVPLPCNSGGPALFEANVFPGSYQVTVRGVAGKSTMPTARFLAHPSLPVTADLGGLAFDVKTVEVAGKLEVNGQLPAHTCSATTGQTLVAATVSFFDEARALTISAPITCANASTFAFSTRIFPGKWTIRARGSSKSELPTQAFNVSSATFEADVAGLVVNVQSLGVEGVVTREGLIPTSMCTDPLARASVQFSAVDSAMKTTLTVPCNMRTGPFAFSGQVLPGVYRVSAWGASGSNLPTAPVTVIERLQLGVLVED